MSKIFKLNNRTLKNLGGKKIIGRFPVGKGIVFADHANPYDNSGLPSAYKDLKPNLKLLYDFHTGSGNVIKDLTGKTGNAIINDGAGGSEIPAMWSNGEPGAILWDGVNDYANMTNGVTDRAYLQSFIDYNKPFSVELFIKNTVVDWIGYILGFYSLGSSVFDDAVFSCHYWSGDLVLQLVCRFDGTSRTMRLEAGKTIDLNTENHLIFCYGGNPDTSDSSLDRIYHNGVSLSLTKSNLGTSDLNASLYQHATIAAMDWYFANANGSTSYVGGYSRLFALYDRVITTSEAAIMYNVLKKQIPE